LLQFDFEDSVGYWICTTSHALRKALEAELSKCDDLTLRQWEVLACLACEEGLTQSEMADRLGIEPPTLAGIVNRMEAAGRIERRTCPDDRRKNRIYPTEKSESIWNETVEICHRIRQKATRGLDPQTLATLKNACDTIRQNLCEAGHPEATAPCLDRPGGCGDLAREIIVASSEAAIG
jgi:DNA-binding MarR family transcriptional regulator